MLFRIHLVGPIFAFVLLFTIFVQIKLSSPNRKQTLRLELVKSTIVSALWVWMLVSSILASDDGLSGPYPFPSYGHGWYKFVNVVVSFFFITFVPPSLLFSSQPAYQTVWSCNCVTISNSRDILPVLQPSLHSSTFQAVSFLLI